MNKILLIIKREYLSRVRKKSFLIMTLLAPILISLFYGIIIYFALNKDIGDSLKVICVDDKIGLFDQQLQSKETIVFVYDTTQHQSNIKEFLEAKNYYGLLTISDSENIKTSLTAIDQPSISTVNFIENKIAEVITQNRLKKIGITPAQINEINDVDINISTSKATDSGAESSSAMASSAIGYTSAMLIYFFIFLYGVQVMKGVIEEKTNRIVEVIISSVKPFQLMMGKIIGIALVGLTQFIIWVALVSILGGGASGIIASQMHLPAEAGEILNQTKNIGANNETSTFLSALLNFNFVYIIGVFIFYFITGYLFYGALFAAIGSAVDNETDTQQFMLPVTMPLVLALVLAQSAVISNPNGSLAFWLSIIPLTSPITMMMRIPFGVPTWELLLSMACMVIGFIGTVWLASRIYRIGILMYGKKTSYKQIGKWLFYKN